MKQLTHLLDTSVFSQPIKNKPIDAVLDRWEKLGDHRICTSAICIAEVKQGLEIRNSKMYWERYNALLKHQYIALPFDESVADIYAQLTAALRKLGKPKPTVDLFIAATAKTNGLTLATLNTKDFEGIPGILVEDWSR